MFFIALAQAIAGMPPPEPAGPARPLSCDSKDAAPGEVVVCGRRAKVRSPYRLDPVEDDSGELPKAELELAEGVKATADTETADVGGFPSKRAMVRIKIKF